MTTLVRGPIKLVTDRPDTVRKINLRAPELRLHGAGIVTDHSDDIPVRDGQVEFEALPGPAVLTLVTAGGAPLRSVDIVVPDEDTATLAECLDQIYTYDPPVVGRAQQFAREAGEHAARAEAGAARVGSAEQVGQWVGEAEVLHDDTVAAANHAETQAGVATEQAGVAAGHAEQAGEDRVQTGADRRQTGEDRAQTGRDAEAAEGWASQSKDAATLAITAAATLERHVADRDPTDDDTAYPGAVWVAPDQVWIRGEESWHPVTGDGVAGLMVPTTNLFDPERVTHGVVLPAGSAELSPNSTYQVTDPIPVAGGAAYSMVNVLRATWLGADGAFISHYNSTGTGVPQVMTAPAEAASVRLSINNSAVGNAQLNEGDTLLPWESGARKIDPSLVDLDGVLPDGDYITGQVTPQQTTFFTTTTNLFDPLLVTHGVAIPIGEAEPTPNPLFQVSDPIPFGAGVTYTFAGINRVTYLSLTGAYVGHHDGGAVGTSRTRTTPPDTTHIRLTVNSSNVGIAQLNLGDTLLPWESGTPRLSTKHLPKFLAPGEDTIFMMDAPGLGEVYTAPVIDAQPGLSQTTVAEVYGWFDALVAAHPEYVTRLDLGVASDGVNHIYAYTLKAPEVATASAGTVSDTLVRPTPATLLLGGVHSYEHPGTYHLWRFAQALCEEWETSSVLDAIRWNVEVVIVPLVNPFGWDPAENGRWNANGVDLARNFEAGWVLLDETAVNYGGPAPLSEPEAQYIDALMQEYSGRAVFGGSFHNFSSQAANPGNLIWQAAASDWTLTLGKKLISRMSRKWNREQEWIVNDHLYYGYSDLGAPGGSEGRALESYGIPGSTFETSRLHLLGGAEDGVIHSSQAMTLGYEATVNYIAMGLHQALNGGGAS